MIRGMVKTFDECKVLADKIEGERRALAVGHGATGDHHANMQRLSTLDLQRRGFEQSRGKVEEGLKALLPDVRDAVAALAGDKPDAATRELLALLDDEKESALVRCEAGAEFMEREDSK
jgi:hypothetical protein